METTTQETQIVNAPNTTQDLKRQILDGSMAQIKQFIAAGQLHVPPDYSPENAIQSAWLLLQDIVDKDKRPALSVCSKASIVHALRTMAIQGLDPAKKHCYLIVYGNSLQCQRSYFGDMVLAKRAKPGIEFYYSVIRKGDTVEVDIERGRKFVKHKTSFDNADNEIVGAYCGYTDADGVDQGATVMTTKEIKQSWSQSKTYKPEADWATHNKFPEEMSLRTVIRKCCKPIINSSNDALLMRAIAESEMESADMEVNQAVEEYEDAVAVEIGSSDVEEVNAEAETAVEGDPYPEEKIGKAPVEESGAPF